MDDIKFKDITDLYKRLLPALLDKKNELKKDKIMVTEIEIWNYLKNNNWSNASDLKLYMMVDDILNLDASIFEKKVI